MQTGSATKRRTGVPRPVRSPENIDAVRASILRSPRRSARKHASTFDLADRSVRRILHDDLHFHPYKMAIVQELSERDWFWGNTFQSAISQLEKVWNGRHAFPICSLVIFSIVFFEIPYLCEPSKNPRRFESQHPRWNCQHNTCYANKSHGKRQKSVYAM